MSLKKKKRNRKPKRKPPTKTRTPNKAQARQKQKSKPKPKPKTEPKPKISKKKKYKHYHILRQPKFSSDFNETINNFPTTFLNSKKSNEDNFDFLLVSQIPQLSKKRTLTQKIFLNPRDMIFYGLTSGSVVSLSFNNINNNKNNNNNNNSTKTKTSSDSDGDCQIGVTFPSSLVPIKRIYVPNKQILETLLGFLPNESDRKAKYKINLQLITNETQIPNAEEIELEPSSLSSIKLNTQRKLDFIQIRSGLQSKLITSNLKIAVSLYGAFRSYKVVSYQPFESKIVKVSSKTLIKVQKKETKEEINEISNTFGQKNHFRNKKTFVLDSKEQIANLSKFSDIGGFDQIYSKLKKYLNFPIFSKNDLKSTTTTTNTKSEEKNKKKVGNKNKNKTKKDNYKKTIGNNKKKKNENENKNKNQTKNENTNKNSQKFEIYRTGTILLTGRSGTGKTLLGESLLNFAGEQHAIYVSAAQLIGSKYGDTEKSLHQLFDEAINSSPSILFIDEIDCLCPKRDLLSTEIERRIILVFLQLLDKILKINQNNNHRNQNQNQSQNKNQSQNQNRYKSKNKNILIIAATNRPNELDSALRRSGRFDNEINLIPPTRQSRYEILEILTRKRNSIIKKDDLREISSQTHGFVGSDLENLVKAAYRMALNENLDTFNLDHLQKARILIKPSAIKDIIVKVPTIKWNQIGGVELVKTQLREAVELPLMHPQAFERMGIRPPKGILLYGVNINFLFFLLNTNPTK
ncbi:aaa-family atpase [Anaeramoeba flamelloides]|uniref:Aaa-family atpase n=1 Tax=Anaeramoeba flamelloides TaxID=1746091 RepID=A0AAV7YKM0_9EUKA|nr:aaa-family atpase [Anaeramoeba flamelloides]